MKIKMGRLDNICDITTIDIPNEFKVRSYDDFERNYFNHQTGKWRRGGYEKISLFLLNLEQNINIDPIKYLYYVYYIEDNSPFSIYDRFHKFAGYDSKSKDSFYKLFRFTFGWKMKNNTITQAGKERILFAKGKKEQRLQKQKENTIADILDIFELIKEDKDEIEVFGRYNLGKLQSFLISAGYMPKYYKLKLFLSRFTEVYPQAYLTEALNRLLKKHGVNLTINKGRISELLKSK